MCVFQLRHLSFSKTTYLFRSPAGGVHEKVVGFLSNLKEVTQLRKVVMAACDALSPSLLATICTDICNSNSMEKVKVTSRVSLFVKVCLFASQHHTNCVFCK